MKQSYRQYYKRLFDVFFAVFLLIGLSWLILLIVIGYITTLQFPIIFKQQRIGKNGIPFVTYKFRTLLVSEASLQERRFLLGDILRATNADEIPQLWNVLKGEMSIVGPRPLPVEYQTKFSAEQNQRHTVFPGITGLAQISGKNTIPWAQKLELDVEYVRRISFKLDCLILLKTITLVLSMKRDVSLNEQKFSG